MKRVQRLFLLAIILMPFHLVEQLLFGIDELYELRSQLAPYYGLFADPDPATVILTFAGVTAVLFFCYGFMAGGIPRLIAASFFGLEFMYELHHIAKTIARGAYFPGAVSAVALATVGALILVSAWREFASTRNSSGVAYFAHGQEAQ